jgi:signal recognition particle GTPase
LLLVQKLFVCLVHCCTQHSAAWFHVHDFSQVRPGWVCALIKQGAEKALCHLQEALLHVFCHDLQDNEPLMRALSNLIALNEPDLVLFVGEALVGNDAVDQLVKFNRSLADLAPNAAMSK